MDKAMKAYIRQLPKEELIDFFISTMRKEDAEVRIPVSIFSARLSTLELIVKYLRDELGYSNKKTALMLNRSAQNTWITYRNANRKHPGRLEIKTSVSIPVTVFADTEFSTLESVAVFLNQDIGIAKIARLLHRDKNTIVTVLSRARKKLKGAGIR